MVTTELQSSGAGRQRADNVLNDQINRANQKVMAVGVLQRLVYRAIKDEKITKDEENLLWSLFVSRKWGLLV